MMSRRSRADKTRHDETRRDKTRRLCCAVEADRSFWGGLATHAIFCLSLTPASPPTPPASKRLLQLPRGVRFYDPFQPDCPVRRIQVEKVFASNAQPLLLSLHSEVSGSDRRNSLAQSTRSVCGMK